MDSLHRPLAAVLVSLAAAALAPGAALARPHAQPLVDLPPVSTHFKDRVLTSGSPSRRLRAHAADVQFTPHPTKEGYSVAVGISPSYATPDPNIAQTYVDFLDSLPHATELAKLGVYIAPQTEVTSLCGGVEGTLACYNSGTHLMVVPGEQTADTTGVTTSYVVTHEYGHHIATFRSNAPFNAFTTGPKYWSSYEMVCDRSLKGLLFPGDEAANYFSNPGEGWAETYAHMKYRDQAWTFSELMKADDGAYAAAARDVATPWTAQKVTVFKGSFRRGGSSTRTFAFPLTLDGALNLHLSGPRKSNYNLAISSDGGGGGHTTSAGSHDALSFKAACRTLATEQVTVTVTRVSGSGPFAARLSYAG
jgi:hypothetical protein